MVTRKTAFPAVSNRPSGCSRRDRPEPAFPLVIARNGALKMRLVEVRPQHIHEQQFRISGLPQQEVADPVLTAGPDHEIRVRKVFRIKVLLKPGISEFT